MCTIRDAGIFKNHGSRRGAGSCRPPRLNGLAQLLELCLGRAIGKQIEIPDRVHGDVGWTVGAMKDLPQFLLSAAGQGRRHRLAGLYCLLDCVLPGFVHPVQQLAVALCCLGKRARRLADEHAQGQGINLRCGLR